MARTGKDPGEIYRESLTEQFGAPVYERIDAPATPEQKARLAKLSPDAGHGEGTGRGSDRGDAHGGAGQRRADRRV